MAHSFDYDLLVIGAGSGGVRAARVAARLGARVAICEDRELGGTCVNAGCIPKKLFVYAAEFPQALEDARSYGFHVPAPRFSMPTLVQRKNAVIERLNGAYGRLLEGAGAEILRGRGRFVGPHTVDVGGKKVTAGRVLIATGGAPHRPDIPGGEFGITSDDVFHLAELPKRVVIIGGGYIALELAGVFRGLGAETVVLSRSPQVLRGFDHDIVEAVAGDLTDRGIELLTGHAAVSVERHHDGYVVRCDDGSEHEGDLVLHATGRRPKVAGLGLELAGVELNERGAIVVNEDYQTTASHVFAVGDVIDRVALTPVAIAEGQWLANSLFGVPGARPNYDLIPTAVFSQPEVGAVGLTEAQALERGHEIRVFKTSFRPLKLSMTDRQERTFMKLIVDVPSDRVLGCHVISGEAAEIVQCVAIAMTCGATKAQLDMTMPIHPTAAEELVTMR